jgi:hypothetical protein
VRESLVIIHEDRRSDRRLVAYVVPTNDQRPTTNDHQQGDKETGRQAESKAEQSPISNLQSPISESLSSILYPLSSELRAFLSEKLPEYMVPSAFVSLPSLPLTPNGKLDRRALPAPDHAPSAGDRSFVAPRTPLEHKLAAIWADLLGVERVGIHDNFFDLGGHSLLVIQAMSRIREELQIDLQIRHLFETPTIARLAESLTLIRWAAQSRVAPSGEAQDDEEEGRL